MKTLQSVAATLFIVFGGLIACEKAVMAPKQETKNPETQNRQPTHAALNFSREAGVQRAAFNPLSEPATIVTFEARGKGEPFDEWTGSFYNADMSGQLAVKTLSAIRKGKTVHLLQTWTLQPSQESTIHRISDPISITSSTKTVMLKGIYNIGLGSLVLNVWDSTEIFSSQFRSGSSDQERIRNEAVSRKVLNTFDTVYIFFRVRGELSSQLGETTISGTCSWMSNKFTF